MDDSKSLIFVDDGVEQIRYAPATMRNRDAIVAVLKDVLPPSGTVLEIASGTGEHAIYFAQHFKKIIFQPTDVDEQSCQSIAAWTDKMELENVLPPLVLDTMQAVWPVQQADAILCINMVHISPWEATMALFKQAAHILQSGAPLYFYGPYFRDGVETAESNMEFDRNLKGRDHKWGLRELSDIDALAEKNGFHRDRLVEMPANNLSLVYRKA